MKDDQLQNDIRRAIADPGSVAGRKQGPSWGRGNDGYAREEETVAAWGARAVMAVLDSRARLLPPDHRFALLRPGSEGRPTTATVHLEGPHEIFRFMVHMLGWQCEFGSSARAVLVGLREHMTPERFDPMAEMFLGADRYAKMRDRFQRDFTCQGCGKDIRAGARYVPTADAGALCAACCKGFPEYQQQLVKRSADRVLTTA